MSFPFHDDLIAPRLFSPGVVFYTDLVEGPDGSGIEWRENGHSLEEGLDCKALAFILLRRAGIPVPPHALFLWTDYDDPARDFGRYLAESSDLWEDLGPDGKLADRLGDVVVTSSPDGPHLTTVVDEARRLGATISRGSHGVSVYRVNLYRGVDAVLRFRR